MQVKERGGSGLFRSGVRFADDDRGVLVVGIVAVHFAVDGDSGDDPVLGGSVGRGRGRGLYGGKDDAVSVICRPLPAMLWFIVLAESW
ncbi:hypothetical protein BDQ12DRAFT_692258 [Crucibulum laeve]|uniref:Uncharacterized protein n=1 Tax=Crucibulum laeve TaxID=68775 RepID=A0A5C3LIN0_9AGAR|nr:hypothetical protein BDQ12DRAFT_692258 [Crucibulum laeve]